MDRETHVAAVAKARLTRIQSHPYSNRRRCRPLLKRQNTLPLGSRHDGSACAAKDREEPVALAVDLDPAMLLENRAEQLVVPREQLAVALSAQLLEQPSRALDVRKQEGDRAARKLGCGWHPAPS